MRDRSTTNGLVAYWKFDEGFGGQISDFSGHGNTAIFADGPGWTAGRLAGAIHTNGTSVIRVNPSSFDFTNDITIASWVRQELTGGSNRQSTLVALMDSVGARKFAVFLDRENKRFCIQTTTIDSCTNFGTYTVFGTWFHFALRKAGTVANIYLNGSLIGGNLATEDATGNDILIGKSTDWRGCNCSFDDFRIYRRALAGREIIALHNIGSAAAFGVVPMPKLQDWGE
jgi:hypothetical protein